MRLLTLLILLAATLASCAADQLPEPVEMPCDIGVVTYTADIEPIIQQSCAYSGCHLGGAPGLYDSYEGVLPALENGSFRDRVISRMDDPNVGMPPNYAPDDRPQDLTEDQIALISCWLDAGFPR